MSLLLIFRKTLAEWMTERCNLFRAHEWDAFSYGKRRCVHCGEEQWLMRSTVTRIGQPSLMWRSMRLPPSLRPNDKMRKMLEDYRAAKREEYRK